MKFLALAAALYAATATASFVGEHGGGGHHGGHGGHQGDDRPVVTIRASVDDTDDISSEFLEGITEANHGGRLLLKEGETYIIGKKLNLTFLDDIEVQLDGEIKVRESTLLSDCRSLLSMGI
jgi:hypothetical protein